MIPKKTYKKESGHWYDKDGEPKYTIIGTNGKERNTTLRDARKEGYVPSVTTVLGLIAKPFLENWKIDQALKSAMSLNKFEDETDYSFFKRCKADSKKIGLEAAKKGTKIHADIEKGFTDNVKSKSYLIVRKWLDKKYPDENWIAEGSFCSKKGYGGKIDLYSENGIFVDFKTKEDLKNKTPSSLLFDEYGMQLSAYAQGCEFKKPERVSIFIDRDNTSTILGHVWDKKTHSRHLKMFNSILTYWKLSKNYDSSKAIK
tara:strand:- start:1555 stop:2328 length:774 start_codon:yes stop_codon:yes gene_type:complete